ncbi:MAG: hypothetical protein HZA30_01795 [Candidatus Omnitrophica bacterium]|nr:hypothetical protein [Candidatus Omnitrophota bacterium]
MRIFLFMIIGLFLSSASIGMAAEKYEPVVRTSIDKNSVFIGDRIRYAIEISSEEDLDVEFSKFPENKIGDFEIKDSGKRTARSLFGKRVFSNWHAISAYSTGEHKIPSFEIRYRQKSGKDWVVKKTGELEVMVKSVMPSKEKVSDIKDIKGPIYFYEINWILMSGIIALLGFFILAIIIYKRRRMAPLKLPHEIALEELEAIRALLSRTGAVKEYYIKISDCVRHYIERRFILKAPEMTTEEFLSSLKDSTVLTDGQKSTLKEFLVACDLVKFAKYAPSNAEIDSVFAAAKNLIEETRQ